MRPGIKTTEFWISLVLTFLGALLAFGVIEPDSAPAKWVGAILATGSAMGYAVSRGLAKKG